MTKVVNRFTESNSEFRQSMIIEGCVNIFEIG